MPVWGVEENQNCISGEFLVILRRFNKCRCIFGAVLMNIHLRYLQTEIHGISSIFFQDISQAQKNKRAVFCLCARVKS